jgi:hypothetical protein
VLSSTGGITTRYERFGPAEVSAGCPYRHVVRFVELARERKVLVGQLLLADAGGAQAGNRDRYTAYQQQTSRPIPLVPSPLTEAISAVRLMTHPGVTSSRRLAPRAQPR